MRVKLLLILVGLNLFLFVLSVSVHDEAFYQLDPHQYQLSTSESGETIVAVHISILGPGLYFMGFTSEVLELLNVIGLLIAIQGLSACRSYKGPSALQRSPE